MRKLPKRGVGLAVLLLAATALAAPTIYGIVILLEKVALASFPAASAANEGGLLYDSTNDKVRFSDGVSWTPLTPEVAATGDVIPWPEGSTTGNATRVAQTVFDGASYTLDKPTTLTSILIRVTGQAGAPTGRFLIYQAPGGNAGVANLVATITLLAIPAAGNYALTPAEGTVNLSAGRIFFLYGRDSAAGSFTMRTRTTQALDLFTANVDTDTHPTTFTTTIAATTSPATFDPREAPSGAATGSASDLTAAIRFQP
jgi:hypothetical protein